MRKTLLPLALVAAVVLVGLAGCTASGATARPTPMPTRNFLPVIFSGSTSGEKNVLPPAGAHSVSITVVCGGQSFFTLNGVLDPDNDGLSGTCGSGTHRYEMAVKPLRLFHIQIELNKGGDFVVETRFSSDQRDADGELTAQCSTMVTVGSDVFNGEDGFRRGKLSLTQWRQKLSDAAGAVQSLGSEKPNVLSAAVKGIRQSLTRPGIAPGSFSDGTASNYNDQLSIVGQVCAENGTPISVNADYGG